MSAGNIIPERKESRRFLECVEDKFLVQLVREPNREGTPLDLFFAKRLLCDEKIGGCLGHSGPEIIVISSHRGEEGDQQNCHLGLPEGRSGPVKRPVERVTRETVLKDSGAQEGWTLFRTEIFKAQEQALPMCWKSQQGRKAAWLTREL